MLICATMLYDPFEFLLNNLFSLSAIVAIANVRLIIGHDFSPQDFNSARVAISQVDGHAATMVVPSFSQSINAASKVHTNGP